MEAQKPKSPWSRGKKAFVSIGSVLLVLSLLGMSWWRAINAEPHITIPTPAMPSPNARDLYIKAANALVDEKKISDALFARRGRGASSASPLTLAERIALVQENAPAHKMLQEGFAFEYREPPARSLATIFPHFAKFRSLARVLAFEAETKAAQNDWNGAINSSLDTIRLGQDVPRGGTIIALLVGIAIQAIGHKSIGNAIDHLNAQEARAAARRMEAIIARQTPYADALQEEKWLGQASLLEMFRSPNFRSELKNTFGDGDNSDDSEDAKSTKSRFQRVAAGLRLYLVNKRQVMANYTEYMDQLIANARQPYATRTPDPSPPNDPINSIMASSFTQARAKAVQIEAQNAQLLLTLALRAYYLEHDKYPERLQALVPSYLQKLPDDPMTQRGTYGYKRDKVGYTLYSIGNNLQTPATPE